MKPDLLSWLCAAIFCCLPLDAAKAERAALMHEGRLICGATLLSVEGMREVAVTAAHCLYDRDTLAPIPVRELRIVGSDEHRILHVSRGHLPRGFRMTPGLFGRSEIARDIARLEIRFETPPDPVERRDAAERGSDMTGEWVEIDRPGRGRRLCPVVADEGVLIKIGCALGPGWSGSGVMAETSEGGLLVAVISASSERSAYATRLAPSDLNGAAPPRPQRKTALSGRDGTRLR